MSVATTGMHPYLRRGEGGGIGVGWGVMTGVRPHLHRVVSCEITGSIRGVAELVQHGGECVVAGAPRRWQSVLNELGLHGGV